MQPLLEGKVVIVTGASSGIGAMTAAVLARHGANVVVNYASSPEKAEAVVAGLATPGLAVQADVRNQGEVDAMVAATLSKFGRVDGVVNNAIFGKQDGPFSEVSNEDLLNMFNFNCIAVANMIRAVRPAMVEQGGGRIVNIVTEVWNQAGAGWSAYLAGKGAMVGMSRTLAAELGPEGITVNMIAPGWMATEKVDTSSEGSKGFAASLPLRRHGSGEEIGKGCVFFLSELGDYVTGAYLPITGGRVNQMGG
ncbi:3-oxoacyl-[acyl-carrier-protein] reductase [soil metagenome]